MTVCDGYGKLINRKADQYVIVKSNPEVVVCSKCKEEYDTDLTDVEELEFETWVRDIDKHYSW